jgi:hypothetical protein
MKPKDQEQGQQQREGTAHGMAHLRRNLQIPGRIRPIVTGELRTTSIA